MEETAAAETGKDEVKQHWIKIDSRRKPPLIPEENKIRDKSNDNFFGNVMENEEVVLFVKYGKIKWQQNSAAAPKTNQPTKPWAIQAAEEEEFNIEAS